MVISKGMASKIIGMLKKGICEPIVNQSAARKIILYFPAIMVKNIIRLSPQIV